MLTAADTAIHVDAVSKRYTLGALRHGDCGRLSEVMARAPRRLWHNAKQFFRPNSQRDVDSDGRVFWALRDVSFEVRQGEVCGVVGRNGAGKSTLLKILSRITEPTSGRFGLGGRVASLLEVGTGFHQELTGRENILLSGITLGMTRAEVQRRFDEIVDFAGIDRFLDTPVKHYSSGMQVRLGFSVAAHLESEILIIDEVLAVGDVSFQKKCLGKLSDVANSGRTALFVSHNMVAVKSLCQSAILLEDGRLTMKGTPDQVIAAHLASFALPTVSSSARIVNSGGIKQITTCHATDIAGEVQAKFSIDEPMEIRLELDLQPDAEEVSFKVVMHFYFDDGTLAFATASQELSLSAVEIAQHPRCRWTCRIPSKSLNEGQYMIEMLVLSAELQIFGRYPELLRFETHDVKSRQGWYGKWAGVMRPDCRWSVDC